MKLTILGAATLTVLGIACTASADEPPVGPEIGVRTGYAIPFGNEAGYSTTSISGQPMGDVFEGQIPIWLDAGYRVLPRLYVGAFGQYGPGLSNNSKTGCGQHGLSCSYNDVMLGIDAHYHFAPGATFDPWAGVGFGYEWANLNAAISGTPIGGQYRGWQFVNVQLGGDFKVVRGFGLGPFAMFSLGQFDTVGGDAGSVSVTAQELHEWLTFGVRGVYDFAL